MAVDISVAFQNQGLFKSDYYPYDICLGDSTFFVSELYFLVTVTMLPHGGNISGGPKSRGPLK